MNEQPMEAWEARLSRLAAGFPYPETPNIAGAVAWRLNRRTPHAVRHRLAWALVLLFVLLGSLLAVPPVRAAVLDFLQIGAVRIWVLEPTATPTPTAAPTTTPRPTPRPTPTPLASVLDLAGETTLVEAQARIDFPIRLPTYPPDLGAPDRVYVQDLGGRAIVLVWLDTTDEDRARMGLTILGTEAFAEKALVRLIQETTVNGDWAAWLEGEHILRTQDRGYEITRLVPGNTLIWTETEGDRALTYRLETDLSLEEAVHIAESLD